MALAGVAVSNIAWPPRELARGIALAGELGLDGIELAPHNVFGGWDVADEEVRAVRARIEDRGLACPALQGILFNVPEAALFGGPEGQKALATQLGLVARMAGNLGAGACVFGAPKQRDPGELGEREAYDIAADFFRTIGPVFADHGTSLAIEANARVYGCRFLTTTAQAVEFVKAVDAPGIGLQIDMGTIFLEDEDPDVILAAAPLAVHAHVSEPQLQPVGSAGIDHSRTAAALRASGYGGFLSIEMRAAEDWEQGVRRAAALLREEYL